MDEFITEYYLIIKKDNRLRQFVLLHLTKLIKRLKNIIEYQLVTKMKKFNYTDNVSGIDVLKKKLKETEKKLLDIKLKSETESETSDNEEDVMSDEKILEVKNEILADLKKNNPELELDTWV